MGHSTGRAGAILGAAALVATAGLLATPGTSNADPAGHKVVYTLTAVNDADFNLFYVYNQPANMAAYNADSYSYLKNETVHVGPGAPWTFVTTLADPKWAFLSATSTAHGGQPDPLAHCDVTIDDQQPPAVAQDDPHVVRCTLGQL